MSRRFSEVDGIMSKVDQTAFVVRDISDKLVEKYMEPLDKEMNLIKNLEQPIPDNDLEQEIISLANILYFAVESQEIVGIKEDTCKAIRIELYNKAREQAQGTVADKNTEAELAVQRESVVLAIYSRTYKRVKMKIDAGYEMLNSLKKVMNKRISEMELSNSRYIGGNKDAR